MPIGIRPINDFAFKKIFGSPANKLALISLLNAILELPTPIGDVTIKNPFNHKDFENDKLSILDIKAIDQAGAIYDVEMQLSVFSGLVQRIVFYGCEIYAEQLAAGNDYSRLKPAFSICLLDGVLWKDSEKVHHRFQFTDQESGRTLIDTLEIHTLELGRYHVVEKDLANASLLDCWLFWLIHAHEYEPAELRRIFPHAAIQQATQTITQIAEITEDMAMYDSREKAIRDRQWELNASRRDGFSEGKQEGKLEGKQEGILEGKLEGKLEGILEGEIKGKIELIQLLQEILKDPVSSESEFEGKSLEDLQKQVAEIQERIRQRRSSLS